MLTDTRIRSAKPREKSYKISDALGLYLLVSSSGAKLWYLRYRLKGKENRLAFGLWPLASGLRLHWQKPVKNAMLHASCSLQAHPFPSRENQKNAL